MVGGLVGLELSERWAVGVRGDVSGFGINANFGQPLVAPIPDILPERLHRLGCSLCRPA
jgi:hypothetical protein